MALLCMIVCYIYLTHTYGYLKKAEKIISTRTSAHSSFFLGGKAMFLVNKSVPDPGTLGQVAKSNSKLAQRWGTWKI